MIIDLLFVVVMLLAIWKGYRRGLIVALFSFVAIFVGIAAALKLSVLVADKLALGTKVSREWLPFVAFILVLVVVVLLVWIAGKAIQKATEAVMLGWLNRLGGILFYAALYALVFSVILFYAEQMRWISAATLDQSRIYPFVRKAGPLAINTFGDLIPWFRDMFAELEKFFGTVAHKIR
jgi:membrane protein required for colicin V production